MATKKTVKKVKKTVAIPEKKVAAKKAKIGKAPREDRGPSPVQVSVLKMLKKKNRAMGRAELSEALDGSFIGGCVMGHKNPDKLLDTSLVGRGLVRFSTSGDESRHVEYELTPLGRKVASEK